MIAYYFTHKLGTMAEANNCAEWAVGAEYGVVDTSEWPNLWNQRHGRIVYLNPADNMFADCDRIINIWRDIYE